MPCYTHEVSLSHPLPSPPFFFFNAPATPAIYTLSLHDVFRSRVRRAGDAAGAEGRERRQRGEAEGRPGSGRLPHVRRSEEHTSELQSLRHLVCRLLLEKKNTI